MCSETVLPVSQEEHKINESHYLQGDPSGALLKSCLSVTCDAQAALDDVRNWLTDSIAVKATLVAQIVESLLAAAADRSQPATIINDGRFTSRDDVSVVGRDAAPTGRRLMNDE